MVRIDDPRAEDEVLFKNMSGNDIGDASSIALRCYGATDDEATANNTDQWHRGFTVEEERAADNDDGCAGEWIPNTLFTSATTPGRRRILIASSCAAAVTLLLGMMVAWQSSSSGFPSFPFVSVDEDEEKSGDQPMLRSSPSFSPEEDNTCVFTDVRCDHRSNNGDDRPQKCYVVPSEYETCMNKIELDVDRTLQTIRNLDAIFQQNYVFYHTAIDPIISHPQNHQPEFGYSLYGNGTDDGRVDLHAKLREVQRQVLTDDRATVATFWNVTEAFNGLRDAHVSAVQGNLGRLSSDFWSGRYTLEVVPERIWSNLVGRDHGNCHGGCGGGSSLVGGTTTMMKTIFHYTDDGELRLDVEWFIIGTSEDDGTLDGADGSRPSSVSSLATIDGLTPLEFLLKLSHVQMTGIAFKSIGPRINALASVHFPSNAMDRAFFWTGRQNGRKKQHVAPSRILKDSFVVEYADGTTEVFHSRIVWNAKEFLSSSRNGRGEGVLHSPHRGGGVLEVDISDIQRQVNEPSCLFRNFKLGTRQLKRSISETQRPERGRHGNDDEYENRSHRHLSGGWKKLCDVVEDGWFTKAYNCSTFPPPYEGDGPLEAGYRIMKEEEENGGLFMMFKLDSFDTPPDLITYLWSELVQAAKDAGVDRLMIDLSNNGGGEVPAGLNLARLMYPEVACEQLANEYDMVYSEPMRIWASLVDPLLASVKSSLLDTLEENGTMNIIKTVSIEEREEVVGIAEAMCIFDLDHEDNFCGDVGMVMANCSLFSLAESFRDQPSVQSYTEFVGELFAYLHKSNPWTNAVDYDFLESSEFKSYERGGVKFNFTRFLEHEPDIPWWNCSTMALEEPVFLEYILIGNGNSGSTANTFQSTVEQLWKNRDVSGAEHPLITVSYGGIPDDTPVTQYAGGTVNDRVGVEDAFVGLSGLHLLSVLCEDTEHDDQVKHAVALLQKTLPDVPYYLQQFSRLTAVEIYNKFMLPDAMPLEYVKMPPGVHIPQMFFGAVFHNPEGLEPLYMDASQHFQNQP